MRTLLLSLFLLIYSVTPAVAGPPACGKTDRGLLRDIFSGAKRIQDYYDVRSDLIKICDTAQKFKNWEKERPDTIFSDSAYTKKEHAKRKEAIYKSMLKHLSMIKTFQINIFQKLVVLAAGRGALVAADTQLFISRDLIGQNVGMLHRNAAKLEKMMRAWP